MKTSLQPQASRPRVARLWKRGELTKGLSNIGPGTISATFDAIGKYKGHASIYAGQTGVGQNVYDQWSGREFQSRVILFRGSGYVSNDGDAFYVVE